MATDVKPIIRNLTEYLDFKGKTILHAGAGGGQILDYARSAKSVIAVDSDPEAVVRLKIHIVQRGWDKRFTVIQGDFMKTDQKVDIVFFEFCLHEMGDPARALEHAKSLAERIVVIDHAEESEWARITDETEKVAASWAAVRSRHPIKMKLFQGFQNFKDKAELIARVKGQGEESLRRAEKFEGQADFRIPMPYCIAVL